MKTKLNFTVTSAVLLLLSACGMAVVLGSGNIVNETREVSGYSQIVFSAPGELNITQNGEEGLGIEADDNLLGYIKTNVRGDVLYINVEPDMVQLYPSRPIRYALNVGTLTRLTLNGSGNIRADELIASNLDFDLNGSGRVLIEAVKSQATNLDLDGSGEYRIGSLITGQLTTTLDGSGDIYMNQAFTKTADVEINGSGTLRMADILVDSLYMRIDGSGDSTLSGEVNHQTVSIQGSGSYDARDLRSRVTNVNIVGSGNSNVWVSDELSINIIGSGDITYRGQPAISKTITGSGDLIKMARH